MDDFFTRKKDRTASLRRALDDARGAISDAEYELSQLGKSAECPQLAKSERAFLVRLLNAQRDREPMPHNVVAIDKLVDLLEGANG
jgi:hypothetical protein